jgi:hypothetical protein
MKDEYADPKKRQLNIEELEKRVSKAELQKRNPELSAE